MTFTAGRVLNFLCEQKDMLAKTDHILIPFVDMDILCKIIKNGIYGAYVRYACCSCDKRHNFMSWLVSGYGIIKKNIE